ncbi:unnamed protein product [Blepharisma stoltei]|uniref:Uncharacterized protein n=1 Tax=Blepharisma stoltei TaxID=1481888 RepID=A0AAU9JNN0_9CILI|nr:unnamed protein product [Blepharisma stoltei]
MERKGYSKSPEYDYLIKLVLIGDAAVGKSSLLLRYVDDSFENAYNCTIGVDFKIKSLYINDKKVKLQIWDTAGQERFKPITNCYFRGSHGCLAVYDICNKESFDNLKSWIHDYRENNSLEAGENILIIGNKIDRLSERTVSLQDVKDFACQTKCEYLECSARSGEGVSSIFEAVAKLIISKMKFETLSVIEPKTQSTKGKSLIPEKITKKSRCC